MKKRKKHLAKDLTKKSNKVTIMFGLTLKDVSMDLAMSFCLRRSSFSWSTRASENLAIYSINSAYTWSAGHYCNFTSNFFLLSCWCQILLLFVFFPINGTIDKAEILHIHSELTFLIPGRFSHTPDCPYVLYVDHNYPFTCKMNSHSPDCLQQV